MNAPEREECHHDESFAYLRDAVKGREIEFEALGTDQFGRTLSHVWVDDLHVNLDLVATGQALAMTPIEGDRHGETLLNAEASAAGADAGIWASDVCGSGPVAQLTIEAVEPDPPGRDEEDLEGERVILRSDEDGAVDLEGWILRDESSRHRYVFPAGATVRPGGSIIITSADRDWRPGGTPVWNNGGDIALLLDPDGRIVDHLRY